MFGLTTTRRYNRDTNALRADNERLRQERDTAVEEREDFRTAARTGARQFASADAANRRLYDRNLELGRRLAALAESDPEYAACLEHRVARLRRVGVRLLNALAVESRRAEVLQARLDDACGLNRPAVVDGDRWQDRRHDKPSSVMGVSS